MKIFEKKHLATLLIPFFFAGCSEFQEPQIDTNTIEVFVPRDSLRTDIATQTFYWYHIDGAEKYELQIVTPSFDRIDQLVLDTSISANKYDFALQPGTYQWSVRGYNSSSSTGYTVHTLFIDSTIDLANQKVILVHPSDKDTSNTTHKILRWNGLYNADSYDLQVWKPNMSGQLIYDTQTSHETYEVTLQAEGSYLWRVRAKNSKSHSAFYDSEFYLDTTRPAKPILISPPQGQFVNNAPIDFSWQHGLNLGSSYHDLFYLATDTGFTQMIETIPSKTRSATVDVLPPGIYYWGVRSSDKAGNKGPLSSIRQFTIR